MTEASGATMRCRPMISVLQLHCRKSVFYASHCSCLTGGMPRQMLAVHCSMRRSPVAEEFHRGRLSHRALSRLARMGVCGMGFPLLRCAGVRCLRFG